MNSKTSSDINLNSNSKRYLKEIIIAAVLAAVIIFMPIFMTGCKHKDQQLNMKNKNEIEIYCFGDSITWGLYRTKELEDKIARGELTPDQDDGGQLFENVGVYISSVYKCHPNYPEVLEESLNQKLKESGKDLKVRTTEDGICGDWITKDSYKRIQGTPDIVIILYSGNNFYFNLPYEGMLEENIKALKERGCYIYLANYGLYPGELVSNYYGEANEYIKHVSRDMNIPLIDINGFFESEVDKGSYTYDELFSTDYIHLTEKGYELLGEYVAEKLFLDIK